MSVQKKEKATNMHKCQCMKLYTENYSLGESFNRSFCR